MKPDPEKTPADFIVIALSPLLIMALVGSLVFFLAEVLYVGQYQDSLLWILFFFVFGAVLVARIAIEYDAARAAVYGLILGGAAWLGMLRYVEYPSGTFASEFGWAMNLGLVAIIWWSTHRLTVDCTMIDDSKDASGEGLMQAAGLEEDPHANAANPELPQQDQPKRARRQDAGLHGWWRRYRRHRDERRRQPHVPGVWVVYFSLAALPLYGLGQSLIPPADEGRRRYVFWLMSIYVASGLGLLLTTSFLGLRRYLRQKNVRMPPVITGVWLLAGAAMIAAFLVAGALLPRPAAEYALIDLPWRANSTQHNASRFAKQGDEPGKGEGRPGAPAKEPADRAAKDDPGRKDKDGKASSTKKEKASNGESEGKGQSAEKGSKKDKASSQDKTPGAGEKDQTKDGNDAKADRKPAPDQQAQPDAAAPDTGSIAPPAWTAKVGAILKWIVLVAFALLIGFFLVRASLTFLANFTGWARTLLHFFRHFWQGLFAGRAAPDRALAPAEAKAKPQPFRMFADPFLTGKAERMTAEALIRYTFEALQSWAAERGLPREPGETPLEFAQRLGEEVPALADEVRQLANYYAGLAYARQVGTDDCRDPLRQLWLLLADAARRDVPVEAAKG